VCEAMASGLPAVAYRLSTLDELFPSAYLGAPLGDRAALADLTVRVLADSSEAAVLSQKGEEAAARYDIDRVAAEELEKILRRSSSRSPARPTATRA
jgi:glycosyltransferase involved in cell wall biosynthesis